VPAVVDRRHDDELQPVPAAVALVDLAGGREVGRFTEVERQNAERHVSSPWSSSSTKGDTFGTQLVASVRFFQKVPP
jgi:hypothetical protein